MELVWRWGRFFGHGAELVEKGTCLIAIICDYFAICLQCRDANAFSFVCYDE